MNRVNRFALSTEIETVVWSTSGTTLQNLLLCSEYIFIVVPVETEHVGNGLLKQGFHDSLVVITADEWRWSFEFYFQLTPTFIMGTMIRINTSLFVCLLTQLILSVVQINSFEPFDCQVEVHKRQKLRQNWRRLHCGRNKRMERLPGKLFWTFRY